MDSQSALINFKGIQYQLSIKSSRIPENSFLQITLKSQQNHEKSLLYFHEFTPEYVENMTLKTGNFKNFNLFVEMILSGLEKRSGETVSLDILTMKDLQKGPAYKKESSATEGVDAKLYLIITYAVAFDRVHYPLPLLLQDEKSYADLYNKYLQVERERLDTIQELSSVMRENDRLKHAIKSSKHPKDSSNFIISDKEAKDLQTQMDRIKRDLSKCTQECKHHRLHEELTTIIYQLSVKIKKNQPQVELKASSSKVRSATRPLYTSGQSLAETKSASRSSSISKTQSTYGSFGPAPKKSYTVIKSEPIEKPARSRSKKATAPASREVSRSPFRRFDPTRYVLEKEAKLEERRSRSTGASRANSLAGSRSSSVMNSARHSATYQRTPSVGSDESRKGGRKSAHIQSSLGLSKERPHRSIVDSGSPKSRRFVEGFRETEKMLESRYNSIDRAKLSRSRPKKESRLRPNNDDIERGREPDTDADRIEERLAKLQQYLQAVLK